jgi:hypothetical protein
MLLIFLVTIRLEHCTFQADLTGVFLLTVLFFMSLDDKPKELREV